jgi:hypothetical protein
VPKEENENEMPGTLDEDGMSGPEEEEDLNDMLIIEYLKKYKMEVTPYTKHYNAMKAVVEQEVKQTLNDFGATPWGEYYKTIRLQAVQEICTAQSTAHISTSSQPPLKKRKLNPE